MKRVLLPLLLCVVCFAAKKEPAMALDEFIQQRGGRLFDTQQKQLLLTFQSRKLYWNTEDKRQIRYDAKQSDEPFTFGGLQITEAVFQFSEKFKLSSIQISIYNRGDCGEWPVDQFENAVQTLQGCLGRISKDRAPETSSRRIQNAKISQMLWHSSGYDVALRWSRNKDVTEYINIQFAGRKEIGALGDDMKTDVSKDRLPHRVEKAHGGDRWIPVPMVNQGQKGYCMDAVMERFMRYYNSSVDQHIIAQIAQSDPTYGTDMGAAIEVLKKNSAKLKIKIREVYQDDAFRDVPKLRKFVHNYNLRAKKANANVVDEESLKGNIELAAVIGAMDPAVFTQVRQKRRPGPESFFGTVKESIDKGIPLLWSVVLFPDEQAKQQNGFHARINNGYNERKGEIIFTDSWGPGHEKKSMKTEEAWATTMAIYSVTPRQ